MLKHSVSLIQDSALNGAIRNDKSGELVQVLIEAGADVNPSYARVCSIVSGSVHFIDAHSGLFGRTDLTYIL